MAELDRTIIDDTGFITLPVGTTAQRPSSPELGMMRWNTDEELVEFYNGSEWIAVGGGSSAPPGEAVFTSTGTQNWTVPDGVNQIAAVVIGAGAGGMYAPSNGAGTAGGGGGLAYNNTISVTPGEVLSIRVGSGGNGGRSPSNGGRSEISRGGSDLLFANGGDVNTSTSETSSFSNGGNAGGTSGTQAFSGGGGAPSETSSNGQRGGGFGAFGGDTIGGGGAGGGGAAGYGDSNANVAQGGTAQSSKNAGGGGGTSLFGSNVAGQDGENHQDTRGGRGGEYGGGGGSADDGDDGGPGAQGAVRIIWGEGRSFPSTNVDQGSSETIENN